MSSNQFCRFPKLTDTESKYADKIYSIIREAITAKRGMAKICDHLYLGNIETSRKIKPLNENGITYIINTVEDPRENMKAKYGDRFQYLGFSSEDNDTYPLLTRHFDEVFNFIEEARKNNAKCLIHCIAGVNRSGCLATAYYMVHKNIGPISAVRHVFEARGMLLSNQGFIERLVKFARDRDLLERDKDKIIKAFQTTNSVK